MKYQMRVQNIEKKFYLLYKLYKIREEKVKTKIGK